MIPWQWYEGFWSTTPDDWMLQRWRRAAKKSQNYCIFQEETPLTPRRTNIFFWKSMVGRYSFPTKIVPFKKGHVSFWGGVPFFSVNMVRITRFTNGYGLFSERRLPSQVFGGIYGPWRAVGNIYFVDFPLGPEYWSYKTEFLPEKKPKDSDGHG